MSQNIKFSKTPISGLYVLERSVFNDTRGYFFRLFCSENLKEIGLSKPMAQINYSHSKKKFTVRGLHFQNPPYTETKIVTCTRGEVFDVAVDLRKGSPTFLQWYGLYLTEKNNLSLYIPDGFAHGFQTMTDESDLLYLHTHSYCEESEAGINILDPLIGVDWPGTPKNISERDSSFLHINRKFKGINV